MKRTGTNQWVFVKDPKFKKKYKAGSSLGSNFGEFIKQNPNLLGNALNVVSPIIDQSTNRAINDPNAINLTNKGGAETVMDSTQALVGQITGPLGNTITGVTGTAGELVGNIDQKIAGYDENGNPIYVQGKGAAAGEGFIRGAGQGASIGSKLGPLGTALGAGIGGLVGGVSKLLNSKKQRSEAQQMIDKGIRMNNLKSAQQSARMEANAENERRKRLAAMNNPFGIFKKGGKVNKDSMKCNSPRRTPNHKTKSHIVKACKDGKEKIIRFGQQGVKGAGKNPKSAKEKARRKSYYARHNAQDKSPDKFSARYWSHKVKWADGGELAVIEFKKGGKLIKRKDGSYSRKGLWDNIRAKRKRVGKKNMPSKSKGTVTDKAIKRSQSKKFGGKLKFQDGGKLDIVIDKFLQLPAYKDYDRQDFLNMLDTIAEVESGDKNIRQIGGGPGRGHFQMEPDALSVGYKRLENLNNEIGLDVEIPRTDDVMTLTRDEQAALTLINMHKNARKNGNYLEPTKVEDMWIRNHWIGNPENRAEQEPQRRQHFRNTVNALQGIKDRKGDKQESPEKERQRLLSEERAVLNYKNGGFFRF